MDDDQVPGDARVAPYSTAYFFPTREDASSFALVSVDLLRSLPWSRASDLSRARALGPPCLKPLPNPPGGSHPSRAAS